MIKSVRGSDPDAALYWMARMLVGGEPADFIARRLVILASEDIGNANPNALLLADAALRSVQSIGMPEARIILGKCGIWRSAKSNSTYKAINVAMALAEKDASPVPLHLRNGVTKLMRHQGYGRATPIHTITPIIIIRSIICQIRCWVAFIILLIISASSTASSLWTAKIHCQ